MASAQKTPVLIVGGGPAGLALAVELGWRGVPCTLIEQTDGTITTPKMNEVNARSMEFCRRWGMVDQVLNCPFPGDFPLDAAFITNLFGYELGRAKREARNDQTPEPHSPYRLQACSQIWFDPMLQATARSFPCVSLRYRIRFDSFTQSQDRVVVQATDLESGEAIAFEADYLVGCDGANSAVRRALGIALLGKDVISNPVHMYFIAPNLLKDSGRAPATFFHPVGPDGLWCSLRIIHPARGMWRLMVDNLPGVTRPEDVDRDALLTRALGRRYPVEWLGISIWKRRSVVAEHYSEGRVFLAGDTVHQLSPTGALGMNTGLGDVVDLGWKLAAVHDGWGGGKLLDTYDLERRPVGARNVASATTFYLNNEGYGRGLERLEEDSAEGARIRREFGQAMERDVGREFRTIGLQLGYRYENSPICIADGTPPTQDTAETYQPTARPGSRAPHVWLGKDRTILDHFGEGFVLLRFGADAPDGAAFKAAAVARKVPFAIAAISSPEAAALYERRLVLVRPDGHVAWRSDAMPADAGAVIDRVRGASA